MTEQQIKPAPQPEPWLRGTLSDIRPLERAVLHSLEMAREDAEKWCAGLDDREFRATPFDLPSPAAQLRHIAGSLDRFLTYANGETLSSEQMAVLAQEKQPPGGREEVQHGFVSSLEAASQWLMANQGRSLEVPLRIGRKGLPTTLGGLLVHMAEHTQRHVGQLITTAKVVMGQRSREKE